MCGIAGFFLNEEPRFNSEKLINAMTSKIANRGPDAHGHWISDDSRAVLGHRRLSILDLSSEGAQPKKSVCGKYILSFNGEIYNYKELKKELLEVFSATFHGTSDTEVLLWCFVSWGFEKTLEKIVGMFAISFYDIEKEILYLARDRFGEKPLYWAKDNIGIFFASELKALRVGLRVKPEIDRQSLSLFFKYGYVPSPYSIFKNVFKLRPGHFLKITKEKIDETAYWDLRSKFIEGLQNPLSTPYDEMLDDLESRLLISIQRQMQSDVPLGAFLSGGIDSAMIVSLMQKVSSTPVKTFTIGFEEKMFDEAPFAKKIAAHLKTEHHELYLSSNECMAVIPKMSNLYDEPFSDSSQIPTYLVSKMAKQHVTVSLSGDAGDELFGGYQRHLSAEKLWRNIEKMPYFSRKILEKSIYSVSSKTFDSLYSYTRFIIPAKYQLSHFGFKVQKVASYLSACEPIDLYEGFISHWQQQIVKNVDNVDLNYWKKDKIAGVGLVENMMFFDLKNYLTEDILTKVDRASMGCSLESRIPFLDHELAEFIFKIPTAMKIQNGVSKKPLRDILYKRVPPELIDRPKMGFGVPLADWLRGPLREWAAELLDETRIRNQGLLDEIIIQKKWQEFLYEKRDFQHLIWDVLMFQLWFQDNYENSQL